MCLLLQSVDITTVKKQDLAFSAPFSINITRNDNVHALVAFFDIEFTHAHKPVYFSTSKQLPKSPLLSLYFAHAWFS
jgi:protein arginine N-methyltransferase 1